MIDELHSRVRAALLEAGIDPMENSAGAAAVIDECLLDIESMHDAQQFRGILRASFTGYGPLQPLFDDPDVEEIWINEPGRVFAARRGRSELTTIVLSDMAIRDLVERMLRASGRRLDLSNPFVDAMLADGSRLHVVIPDITKTHWSVNIRRFVVRASHVDELVRLGTLTEQAAAFLEAAVVSGLNIIVAGGTQAGKTTMLNALLGCVPSHERLISCEEVFEIRASHPDWVPMQTRDASLEGTGEVTLRRLVREALRMRPTRLIVGEVRQAEALDLLVAMNSGMPSMATLHANSAREAVTKLCTLPLLAGQNIPGDFVVPTVAGSVDLVVHVATLASGRRVVREVSALSGRAEQGVIELAEIFSDRGVGLERRSGFPPHPDRFERAGIDLARLLTEREPHVRAA
jgi:pilus assembly protein CpaF